MKHFLIILNVLAVMSTFNSCSSYSPITDLDAFATELENNSSGYTVDDWKNAFKKYEEILASMEGLHLTEDETREFGRINGICTAHLAKGAVAIAKDASSTGLTFLEGLFDGFSSTLDEEYIENTVETLGEEIESLIEKYE